MCRFEHLTPKYIHISYLNYLLLYVLVKLWLTFPEDGDNAETCSSCRIVHLLLLPNFQHIITHGINNVTMRHVSFTSIYYVITQYVFSFLARFYRFIKGKAVPQQARCGPEGSRRFRLTDFHHIRHFKVVRSSASRTGRLYPPGMFLVLIFTRG